MTKNNLQIHLDWLLRSKPAAAAPALLSNLLQAAQVVNVLSQHGSPDLTPITCDQYQESDGSNALPKVEHTGIATSPQSPRPVRTGDEMARLHVQGAKTPKPQLLSKKAIGDAEERNISSANNKPISLSIKSDAPHGKSGSTTDTENSGLEEDGRQLSSSSTFEAFGEPQQLWTESSAQRNKPLNHRGKKRKSSEIGTGSPTSFVAVSPLPLSEEGFIALEDLEEERSKKPRHAAGSSNEKVPESFAFEDGLDLPQPKWPAITFSPGKILPQELHMNSSQPVPAVSLSPKPKRPPSSWSPDKITMKKQRIVVEDSEGEDGASQLPNRAPAIGKQSSPFRQDMQQYGKNSVESVVQATTSASAVDMNDLPYKYNGGTSIAFGTGDPSSTPDLPNENALESFLECNISEVESYTERLDLERKALAQKSYDIILGTVEDKSFDFNASKSRSSSLALQMKAFGELLVLRKQYEEATDAKAKAGRQLIAAIDAEDTTLEVSLGIARREANNRVNAIKQHMSDLLSRTASSNRAIGLPPKPVGSTARDENIMSSIIVQSTQASVESDRPLERFDMQEHSANSLQRQRKGSASTQNLPAQYNISKPKSIPTGPNHHDMAETSRSPLSEDHAEPVAPVIESTHSLGHASRLAAANEGNDSSTHVGWPQFQVLQEEEDLFGEDGDYEEMLRAVDHLDALPEAKGTTSQVPDRTVLLETTGNEMRRVTTRAGASAVIDLKHPNMQHLWSKDVLSALKRRFRLANFRPNQLEAINTSLSGRDTFVLMPTGGGKSLCYQLPSVVSSGKTQGVTVVFSPLLSLMQDQVEHLQALDIQAVLLNGETSAEHRKLVREKLRHDTPEMFIQLLYITPEMIVKSQALMGDLTMLHQNGKLARIVIDEAHCVSQWGHDFRPEYKKLGEVRQQFPGVPVMALTATATANVKLDVIHNLNMSQHEVYTSSFNRPNLVYEVRKKAKDITSAIAGIIREFDARQSGIVYCLSRNNCEVVARALQDKFNIKAHHYHAGMPSAEKVQVQKDWQHGRYQVIVATIAFGMGIDKSDVRYVIHQTLPKSLEGYYQETGRAGRDGNMSKCILFFSYGDLSKLQRMIDEGEGSYEQKDRQRRMLRDMVHFCESRTQCRRVQVLHYFGERFSKDDCGATCDNCQSTTNYRTKDYTEAAGHAIKLVRSLSSDKVTLLHCVEVWRGANSAKVKEKNHDKNEYFGAANRLGLSRNEMESVFFRLLSENAIEDANQMNKAGFPLQYLQLGRLARKFELGEQKLFIDVPDSTAAKSKLIVKTTTRREAGASVARGVDIQSTYVSTPSGPKRRLATLTAQREAMPRNEAEPKNSSDSFIVDDDHVDFDSEDSMFPAFEPVRNAGESAIHKKRELGPPITTDEKLERLDNIHREVVEEFVHHAEKKAKDLMMKKGRKFQPFSIQALREMAISFPNDVEELGTIPGVRPEALSEFGPPILKLIASTKKHYHEILGRTPRTKPTTKRTAAIIDISSDEEHVTGANVASDDDLMGDDLDSSPAGERSTYFQDSAEVRQFNQQLSHTQTFDGAAQPRERSQTPRYGRGGRSSYKARGGGNRRGSGAYRRKGSTNTAAGSSRSAAPRGGGGGRARARNIGFGMGAMPT